MCPSSVYARKSLPPETTPPPTPGAEGQREKIGGPAAGAELELRVRRAARVVLHLDRQPEPLLHLVGEAHVADRDVDRAQREAMRVVDS